MRYTQCTYLMYYMCVILVIIPSCFKRLCALYFSYIKEITP
nr:MAG TPA: hypothetical protein [Caudoviricetes sp.]